jgi:hydroxymethylglutaryl-CoA lyase
MDKIIIHEVGMRDGLQVEQETVPTDKKIEWINKLFETGVDIIQVGSFVNPKRMPQMADTDQLFKIIAEQKSKPENVTLSGLVLNEKGLERGMECGVEMFCMGVSASETHSQRNTGMTTGEALTRIINMAKSAASAGKKVQVSVQSAFGCGFEGPIPKERVLEITGRYFENGINNISLADTAGHAYPRQVEELISEIMKINPDVNITAHFHDTYGLGISNCYSAYNVGVTSFESAFAGLGGCPFTAKASGNVCTEDLVNMFNRMGMRKDIDVMKISEIAKETEEFFKREMPGKIYRMGVLNY